MASALAPIGPMIWCLTDMEVLGRHLTMVEAGAILDVLHAARYSF